MNLTWLTSEETTVPANASVASGFATSVPRSSKGSMLPASISGLPEKGFVTGQSVNFLRPIPTKKTKPRFKPRSRIRKRSLRHAEKDRLYNKLCRRFKQVHPRCQFFSGAMKCTDPTKDVHHTCGRGPYLNDTSTWMAVCRHHHQYIHDNPRWSSEMTFIQRDPPPPREPEPIYLNVELTV